MDRNLQIEYIERVNSKEYYQRMCYHLADYLFGNHFAMACDILNLSSEEDQAEYIQILQDKAYDHLISKIDWDSKEQCKNCHDYYDVDYDHSNGFCSEDCEAIYADISRHDYREDER